MSLVGLLPSPHPPFEVTSRAERIDRVCLDQPRLPKDGARDHPGGKQHPKDDQLDPEEQDRDENHEASHDQGRYQQPLSEVAVPEVRQARPQVVQRLGGDLAPAGPGQLGAAREPSPAHSPLDTIGSHDPPRSQL